MQNTPARPKTKRRIPHRMETARLCLRCYGPEDAEMLRSTVERNVKHLGEFMPWIHYEPQTLDEKVELILGFRSQYDADRNLVMGIFDKDAGQLLGGTGIHPGGSRLEFAEDGSGPVEIGYWIDQANEGKGFVTESVCALAVIAFRFRPLERLIIRMEPANTRSESIAQKLGFALEGTTRRSISRPSDESPTQRRDARVYSLLRHEFEDASWRAKAESELKAWDALGRELPLRG